MSSSGSPPSCSQTEVAETSQEVLPEVDERGGEIHGAGGHSASTSRAHDRAPPRPSQVRRRGGGGHSASQRAPDSDGEEAGCINIDLLIDEVREREPLWNMADRRHADTIVTRRLWDEVCHAAIEGWEELNSRAQKKARDKLQKRWRSIRDRFKKELNQEMQAPSGSGGRRSKYRYFRALSFLRTTMVCRSTVCSTREPASNPSGAIPEQSATGEHRHSFKDSTSIKDTIPSSADKSYMKDLFKEFRELISSDMDEKCNKMKSSIDAFTSRIEKTEAEVADLSITKKISEVQSAMEEISYLKTKVANLEARNRRNNCKIRGISENVNEELFSYIKTMTKSIFPEATEMDLSIDRAH
ncbi:uncharacterized protein ACNLHF_026295 [Anomaloglossus baeobatrachus]